MTTTVKVLNEGPGSIKVEQQGRDEGGRFYAISESQLKPGEFKTLVCHKTASIQVIELQGPPSPEPA